MKKNSKGLFSQLVKNYITFVLVLIAILAVSNAFIKQNLREYIEEYFPEFFAEQIIRPDYKNIDISDIQGLDGWIEIVDLDGNIVFTKGDKQDSISKYTTRDLINYSVLSKDVKFNSFTFYFTADDGNDYYCLIKYPVENVEVLVNLKRIPYYVAPEAYNIIFRGGALLLIMFTLNITLYSLWTSYKISKPLENITNGMDKMISGDYDINIQFKAAKEFESIRETFNTMAEKLKNAEDEKRKVEESKTRLLVDLSHDIKTPITSISCFSKMLSEGLVEGDDKKLRYYNTIYNKSERVSELMDNLFDFVKLDSVDFKLDKQENDICEFLRKILADNYDELDDNGFDLDIRIPNKEIIISYDKTLLSRAFSNIISNAIKYNPQGTKLRIEISETKDLVSIELADNGIGIPNDVHDQIFDAFVRGDKSRKTDGGTGLGLAIAKKIFDSHGWSINLSENKIEKTVFTIICMK